jgi:hypothetical protein
MTEPQAGGHGPWLREQRQARGWNIQQMARKLRDAGVLADDTLPGNDCLGVMIRRWEKGYGISERYKIHYCHAFQIPPRDFGGTPAPQGAPGEPAADSTARPREPATIILVIVMPATGQPATPADGST